VGRCPEDGSCPQYDGKRCYLMGCRPTTICEPWAQWLSRSYLEGRDALSQAERERDEARELHRGSNRKWQAKYDEVCSDFSRMRQQYRDANDMGRTLIDKATAALSQAEQERVEARAEVAGLKGLLDSSHEVRHADEEEIERLRALLDEAATSSVKLALDRGELRKWQGEAKAWIAETIGVVGMAPQRHDRGLILLREAEEKPIHG
jgi:hypothetical protein